MLLKDTEYIENPCLVKGKDMKRYILLIIFTSFFLFSPGVADIADALTARLDPAVIALPENGETFNVNVVLDDVTDLGSFEFDIDYPQLIVNVNSASDIVLGPCLASTGRSPLPIGSPIDNTVGTLSYAVATLGSTPAGFSGSNCVLATITFTVVSQNEGTLDLNDTQITDTQPSVGTPAVDLEQDSILIVSCASDEDCDDGIFCNGMETCQEGSCVAVSACPPAIDGCVSRNNSCDEVNDTCVDFADDSQCDNGLSCDGSETCNIVDGQCLAGTPMDCDDGVSCTDDSCAEVTGCVNTPNDSLCPDDGILCNGTEFCDAVNDCSSTGDVCAVGESCDEVNDMCVPISGEPLADIKVNNLDGPVSVATGTPFSMTGQLDAGNMAGQMADWWVLASTPLPPPDDWYHYDLDKGWIQGMTVTYQGALFDLESYEIQITDTIPVGTYTVYFGVDMLMNSQPDTGNAYYDSVEVNITQ
jgi:hypothetical protein